MDKANTISELTTDSAMSEGLKPLNTVEKVSGSAGTQEPEKLSFPKNRSHSEESLPNKKAKNCNEEDSKSAEKDKIDEAINEKPTEDQEVKSGEAKEITEELKASGEVKTKEQLDKSFRTFLAIANAVAKAKDDDDKTQAAGNDEAQGEKDDDSTEEESTSGDETSGDKPQKKPAGKDKEEESDDDDNEED